MVKCCLRFRSAERAIEELRQLEPIVPHAVRSKTGSSRDAQQSGDVGVVLHAVKMFKSDRGVALAAVAKLGIALEYCSECLKADRDVVFAAVRQQGRALQYASAELRADPGVVREAVRQDGMAVSLYLSLWLMRSLPLP